MVSFRAITKANKGIWNTEVKQDKDGNVSYCRLESNFGTLFFGERSDNLIGWSWKEQGGGGPVTLLYSINPCTKELLIGLRNEKRDNLGGPRRWCAIGGFVDVNESHRTAQQREAVEEVGINTMAAIELAGLPLVSNRLYFIADPDKGEGVHVYAMEVPFVDLQEAREGYKFAKDPVGLKESGYVRFFPWREAAIISCDTIACAAMLRLVAHVFIK